MTTKQQRLTPRANDMTAGDGHARWMARELDNEACACLATVYRSFAGSSRVMRVGAAVLVAAH